MDQFRLCSNPQCQNRNFLKYDACPTCGAKTGLYSNADANQLLAAKRAPQLQMQNKQALYSAPAPPPPPMDSFQPPPPPPPMRADSWTQGMSTEAEEHLLGGLTSGNLHVKGRTTFGYGIYATNRRIIGVKSMKGLWASGLFGFAGLWVGRTDQSAKVIAELETKKDLEIRKENILQMQMKKPQRTRVGYLNILLISGGNITVTIAEKKHFEVLKNLMAAFHPQGLRVEE